MKKKKEIPPEYKCSRCEGDMRDDAPLKDACLCCREHPLPINKSGIGVWIAQQNYEGFGLNYPFSPIDF